MVRRVVLVLAVLASVVPAVGQDADLDLIPPVDGPITRHFEPPPTPYTAGHRGLDFETPRGADVLAASDGIVAFAGQVGGALFVSIDHPVGLRTTYSFLDVVLVTEGQSVAQGDRIAVSGSGHAGVTPPHLHFGLRRGSEYLDPEPYLIRSMRRNLWRVVRLVPLPSP
jgi:murein DD-endopeptidase MepM/ murein hydrolase activator NlpD